MSLWKLIEDYGLIILALLVMVTLIVIVIMFANDQGLVNIDITKMV